MGQCRVPPYSLTSGPTPGAAAVIPTAVPADTPLGGTSGVRNRIEIRGEPVGTVGFDGPGAGGGATSSAVLGDLVALARGGGSTWAGKPAAGLATLPAPAGDETSGRWFAFVPGIAAGQVVRDLAEDLSENEAGVAIRTRPMTLAALRSCLLEVTPASLDLQLYAIDDFDDVDD